MFRKEHKHTLRHYNLTMHQGGLGDLIARLPAIKYVLDHHGYNYYQLWVHDYGVDLCKKVFGDRKNLIIRGLSEAKGKYKDNLPARSPDAHKITNLSCHMTDHAFYTIVHKGIFPEDKNYIQIEPIDVSKYNLPKNYAVITTGFTSNVREWLPEYVNGVTDWLLQNNITPVYLGRSFTKAYQETGIKGNFKADYSKGINLIDQTNLFEAHGIMAGSMCVIGLDNGLLHLAGMSKASIVYGFTTVNPEHRLPYRDGILGKNCYVVMPTTEELACIGCQSNMNFAPSEHNFTDCWYKDYKCLTLMSTDKWVEQIKKVPAVKKHLLEQQTTRKEVLRSTDVISFDEPNDDNDFEETD